MNSITRINYLADRLRQEHWHHTVYRNHGRWSVIALLAHFVSAEIGSQQLLHEILFGKPGAALNFDIDAFNESEVTHLISRDHHELTLDFKTARALTVTLVENMIAADLKRCGRHPWLGNASLTRIIKLIYRHNQIHERDIRRALQNHEPSPATQEQIT